MSGVATTKTPLRVLVIDDDLVDRLSVRRSLRSSGVDIHVEEADGCTAALERLRKSEYDCVFLDYFLPDGNGLTVMQDARAAGVRCPFVMLTGQGDERTAVEIMKAGAHDYLPKAHATPDRVAQSLRSAVRLHQAEQQAMLAQKERERALLFERHARDEAEAAQQRLAFLAEVSALTSASLDHDTTLQTIARLPVPTLADWCFVDLLLPDGAYERKAVAHDDGAHAELAQRLRRVYAPMPNAPHGISRVMATARSEVITEMPDWVLVSLARDAEHLELMRALHARSLMTVPLTARGRTLGAITLISREPGRYSDRDLEFAEELARRAALGLDNARLFLETKRAQDELRRQLDFTTTITGSLAEGVCAIDREGRITFANPAAEAILGRGDLAGLPLHAHVHAHTGEEHCALATAGLDGAVLRVDDDLFARADGGLVPVSYVVSPIRNGGVVTGAVVAFHDATERRRAEAELDASRRQLAQSEKLSALGTLVSGVAHELRTPLTYISNNLFLLQARLDAAARQDATVAPLVAEGYRFSQAMLDGIERINALVKDLRPFSGAQNGSRASAGLHEVVGAAVDLFRATHRGRVEVIADLAPTPPLSLDRGQLQRVVINLLVNAADAMPSGGRVHVTTRGTPSSAIVEVLDEGPGIPPEIEARIFDPFFTTKPDGTGLGLAISRQIVEAHGGAIACSTRLGEGTRFTIVLPLDEASKRPAASPASATTP